MGKVKGAEKFSNEIVVVNRRRKKRKKELDNLRKNVLETKRKLREKTAPPKTHTSTFNKILNSFADRRQDNDNQTQGFDNKGRRSGVKKICNRLLPSRKPQVGIFANGAKGAEIKRVNLPLNESDKARFEGDLQKVLEDGKRKCKESRSDALNTILQKPSAEGIDTEKQEFVEIPEKKLIHKPVQTFFTERQRLRSRSIPGVRNNELGRSREISFVESTRENPRCTTSKRRNAPDIEATKLTSLRAKRKLQVPIELDDKIAKKLHSEIEDTKFEQKWETSTDQKWKRSLFQDEVDDFEPISELNFEQLQFSPIIGKPKFEVNRSKPKIFLDMTQEKQSTKRLNFNYGQFGKMATTKYEKLCAMVCAENFDTCLQEIPHIDPLKKVKQSLMNFYIEACNKKLLRNNVKTEVRYAEESSRGACFGNLKNFPHLEATETSSTQSKSLITKAPEVIESKNISCITRGPPSSGISITGHDTSSLDVNYDSSRKSLRSDILDFYEIDEEAAGPSTKELNMSSNSRLAGIPSHRKKTMLRYLKEVNNLERVKVEDGSICPLVLSAVSAENDDVQNCYLGDPLKRHEILKKQSLKVTEKKLDDIRGPSPFEIGIAKKIRNSLDLNCDGVGKSSESDLKEFAKIDGRAKPTMVNLGSASSSTLARIPSARGEFMLKFLQGIDNSEPRKEDRTNFISKGFIDIPENNKLRECFLPHSLRKQQIKDTSIDSPKKNERHVPAILRKSRTTKRNEKSNTAQNVLAKEILEIRNHRLKTSNFNFEKLSSETETTPINDLFDNKQTLGKPQSIANLFPIDFDDSSNSERLNLAKKMSQTLQFQKRGFLLEVPLCDINEKPGKIKRNFIDERFPCETRIGERKIAKSSKAVNFSREFDLPPSSICPDQNAAENDRQSLNLPIFMHQERSNAKVNRISCNEREIPSLGNQESQRFPVFLKRKTTSSKQNGIKYEGRYEGRGLSTENGNPKVIIIQNPNLREYGQDVRHEMQIPQRLCKNENGKNPKLNGLTFSKFPQNMQMQMPSMQPVQLRNGRQKIQEFQAPAADPWYQNVGQQVEQLQIPRCVCKTELENVQHVQLPRIVYQNGMRKVVNHKYTVQELGNNPINFFQPTTLDVTASRRMFQHDPSQNAARIPSSCCENMNLETQRICNSTEQPEVQFFDRRLAFVLPKNEPQPFSQDGINLPIINDQISHRQEYSPVLSGDKNSNYKYIIDPRYPQAGYKWNQIVQSGAEVHHHVIQPAYNATDACRSQLPHTYFSNNS